MAFLQIWLKLWELQKELKQNLTTGENFNAYIKTPKINLRNFMTRLTREEIFAVNATGVRTEKNLIFFFQSRKEKSHWQHYKENYKPRHRNQKENRIYSRKDKAKSYQVLSIYPISIQ